VTNPASRTGTAVICERHGADAAAAQAFVDARGHRDVRWFAPRDLNDVEDAIEAGRIACVVFVRFEDFLTALWDEELAFERWLSAGVRVGFVHPPDVAPAGVVHADNEALDDADTALAAAVDANWRRWRRARRRRTIVAGLILSALALAAAFGITCAWR
jgi:hypothetical protein